MAHLFLNIPRLAITAGFFAITLTVSAQKPGDADFPQPSPTARHAEKVAAVKSGKYDLVLIGDSITHTLDKFGGKYAGLEAVWNKHYAPRRAINLAHNGYRTEKILWNLQNGELDFATPPKVLMLLIGTNNADGQNFPRMHRGEEIFAGTKAIVDLIRRRLPTTKILILRPFPKGLHAQRNEATSPPVFSFSPEEVEAARRAGELTASLADGKQVFWLDVGHIFLRPDGTINPALMWDLLHPNAAGAEAWAQAVEPTLAHLMGDKPIVDPEPVSVVPVPRRDGGYDWMARHQAALTAKATKPQIVFIGDSITHHLGGVPAPTGPFLSHRGDQFWQALCPPDRPGLNLGFGADWTQHVLWRLDHGALDGISPKSVVLMIGTNNILWGNGNPAEVVAGVRACLTRIRNKTPMAKLILMGALPCRNPATHPNRAMVRKVNEGLKMLAAEAKCEFLDIGDKFVDANGIILPALMDDAIHPTPAGYQIWRDALLPLLDRATAATPTPTCIADTPAKATWPGHPWWPGRFAEKCKLAQDGGFDVMLIGDSITHGIDNKGDNGVFEQLLAPAKIGNFGDAGDTTENVLWRLDNGQLSGQLNPKVVMVMIGTNNTRVRMDPPAQIAAGVKAIVNRISTRLPKTQILLLGIFPFGHSPAEKTRVNNAQTNELLAKLDGSNDGRVHFLDLTPKFLDPNGLLPATLMPDFLHPNAKGYQIWAEAVAPVIKKLCAQSSNQR